MFTEIYNAFDKFTFKLLDLMSKFLLLNLHVKNMSMSHFTPNSKETNKKLFLKNANEENKEHEDFFDIVTFS